MSAKDQIKRIVDAFKREPQLKDKTDGMAEGLMLGAQLADDANELSKETDASFKALQREYTENGNGAQTTAEITVARDGELVLDDRLKRDFGNVNAQLAQTFLNLDQLRALVELLQQQITNMGDISPEPFPTLADLEARYPNGDSGVYVVSADGYWYWWNQTKWVPGGVFMETAIGLKAVLTANIANNAVTVGKTSFGKVGKNKFQKSKALMGKLVDYSNGNLIDNQNYFTYSMMPVHPGQTISLSTSFPISFIDMHGNYKSGLPTEVGKEYSKRTIVVPEGIFYMTVSSHAGIKLDNVLYNVDTFMIVEGTTLTEYEEFYIEIPGLKYRFKPNEIPKEAIAQKSISRDKLDFLVPEAVPSKNLHDKNTAKVGFYVNNVTGEYSANPNHVAYSADIYGMSNLTFSKHDRSAFYDIEGKHIPESGLYENTTAALTRPVPSGAYVVKYSYPGGMGEEFQLESGTEATSWVPYGYTLDNLISPETLDNGVFINLPKKLYALVGQELNIYFDNIIVGNDYDYTFDVDSSKGHQYKNFWRYVPESAENLQVTIKSYKGDQLVASASFTVISKPVSVGNGITKKIMKIGDSTTDNGNGIVKLNENFSGDVMNIQTIGSRGSGINLHEGRSGWTAKDYCTISERDGIVNNFWNPTSSTFDYGYGLSNKSLDTPDVTFINLGINDMFNITSDLDLETKITETLGYYQKMIESIHNHNAETKVAIGLTIPPNYSQDAFGKQYLSNQTRARYKRNHDLWVKSLIEKYDNREGESIYLVPIHTNLDTRYNMGLEETPVNARNPITYTSPVANGAVHPVESGYWQIADVEWFFLKSFET